MIKRHKIKDYALGCKEALHFTIPTDNDLKIPKDFQNFINEIEGVGRLSYERIFDFMDPELVPIIIYYLSVKKTYLKSGEWTLRQNKLIKHLLYRLWMGDATHVKQLLIGLVLLKCPLAVQLCLTQS